MAAKSFSASVRAFTGKTKKEMREVFVESVQDVVEIAQTPGPTVATTKKAIAKGIGSGRGKSKRQGPVQVANKGGRMPVDTGNLRNSLASGLNGSFSNEGAESYAVIMEGFTLGDVAQFAWTAPYARRMELGFSGTDSLGRTYEQAGYHFVGAATAQWPQIVTKWAGKISNGN